MSRTIVWRDGCTIKTRSRDSHGSEISRRSLQSARHFLDFVISGKSLWELTAKARDLVSVLCAEYASDETVKAVKRLLLQKKPNLLNNRRPLFICSECGDLGCGAITITVEKQEGKIISKDFGYENNYEDNILFDDYRGVDPFTFNAVVYEQILLEGMSSLKSGKPKLNAR